MKVIVGELPLDEQGFFHDPVNGQKFDAALYVKLFPSIYRIEDRIEEKGESKMFTVQPVTAAQIETMHEELAKQGTQIQPGGENQFTVTGHGITAKAVFDPAAQSLTVTVIHKPFYILESAIQSGIQNALKTA